MVKSGLTTRNIFESCPWIGSIFILAVINLPKWLKDRKDQALNFEDILHYQKIIVALTETNRIMQSQTPY